MPDSTNESTDTASGLRFQSFRTTHWSVVLHATAGSRDSEAALEKLCRAYWNPIYTFVRQRGYPEHEAQDLTQEFFIRLLGQSAFQTLSPDKGRFRTYLLAALKNFLTSEWRAANRQKRGGGREFISYEEFTSEEQNQVAAVPVNGPEVSYDLCWARVLFDKSMGRLNKEMDREGLQSRFSILKPFLQGQPTSYAEAAERTGLSEPGVTSAIHRMRKRYAEILRDEVSQTVASPSEIEAEIRHLITILAAH